MNFRKVLAFLLACTLTGCAFVSCGSDEEKEEKTSKSDKADKDEDENEDEDEDDKDSDEEEETKKSKKDDDEEEETEEEETEEETEEEEEETTKKSKKSSSSDGDLVGEWSLGEIQDGLVGGLVIKDDGHISVRVDASEMMYFDYPSFYISGMEVSEDYIDFDGTVLSVVMEGTDLLTLTRASGSGSTSSYDGTYKFTSGIMADSMSTAFASELGGNSGAAEISAIIDGKTMFIDFEDLIEYTDNGDGSIEFSGSTDIFGDLDANGTLEYEIDGDTLTLTDTNGDTHELTRW